MFVFLFFKDTVRFLLAFLGHKLPGKQFVTPHVFHELLCYCQRESMSFIVSAIDPQLIPHGPLLVFHTPESSHDPVLAAEAGPRPPGAAILFQGTHRPDIGRQMKKKKHAFTYRTAKHAIDGTHIHRSALLVTLQNLPHTHTHTFFAHMHIHRIPRNP